MHADVNWLEHDVHLFNYFGAVTSHLTHIAPHGFWQLVVQFVKGSDPSGRRGVNPIGLELVLPRDEDLSNTSNAIMAFEEQQQTNFKICWQPSITISVGARSFF